MKNLVTSFARNAVFANIVLLFIFFGGVMAITHMTRETFPDIQLDIVRVAVVWLGADPEEVEEGVRRKIEESFYEAVCRGGARRFRAIFLTTVTTVGGLAPLILERDRQAQALIPMTISLASGIAFATLLTLLLAPCLMCILNDLRRLAHFLIKGTIPTPEQVEPARLREWDSEET